MNRLVNGVLNDCSMAGAVRATGMAFDHASPALRAAMAQDRDARAYMRIRTKRPALTMDVNLDAALDRSAELLRLNRLLSRLP